MNLFTSNCLALLLIHSAEACPVLIPISSQERASASVVFKGRAVALSFLRKPKGSPETKITFKVDRTLKGSPRNEWIAVYVGNGINDGPPSSLVEFRARFGESTEVGLQEHEGQPPVVVQGHCSPPYLIPLAEDRQDLAPKWGWNWEAGDQFQLPEANVQCKKSFHPEDKGSKATHHTCGFILQNGGWWDIQAQCSDGFHWSYVLKNTLDKDKGAVVLCQGISLQDGFVETPCEPFREPLQKIETNAETVKSFLERNPYKDLPVTAIFRKPIFLSQFTRPPTSYNEEMRAGKRPSCFAGAASASGPSLPVIVKQLPLNESIEAVCDSGTAWLFLRMEKGKRRVCKGHVSKEGEIKQSCEAYAPSVSEWSCSN